MGLRAHLQGLGGSDCNGSDGGDDGGDGGDDGGDDDGDDDGGGDDGHDDGGDDGGTKPVWVQTGLDANRFRQNRFGRKPVFRNR